MKRRKMSIVGIMLLALVSAFIMGAFFMKLHSILIDSGNAHIWDMIYALFFQDITVAGSHGIGIFYVVGTLFMNALRLTIIPLVFTSLVLAMSSISDLKKLGRIAYKGVFGFLFMYFIGCMFAGGVAFLARNMNWISISSSITSGVGDIVKVDTANPLSVIMAMVPLNFFDAISNNGNVLAVVFVAIIIGLCIGILGDKANIVKKLTEEVNEIIQLCIGFLINKLGPIAIFSLIVRAFALYGFDQMKPVFVYVMVTIGVLLVYLLLGYPLIIALTTKLNPFIFMKKISKVALLAFSTASSAPAFPLNLKTNVEELGVSEEIANFILPLGMTINMNGTSIMHIIGTIFIATVSGYHVTLTDLLMMSFLSILAAAGTPALPAAGTVLLFTVMNGMGYVNEMALITYSLILAINKPVEMVLTSLNVVGDATTSLIVANSENELDREIFYDKKVQYSEVKEVL